MVEFEFNSHIDTLSLVEFFARCGWSDLEAGVKLEWALATSEDWVACRLDGELIGFGRSYRLDAFRRMVFDVLVDTRYRGGGLREQIVALLSASVGRLEEVSVFVNSDPVPTVVVVAADQYGAESLLASVPDAPEGAYLGRRDAPSQEEPWAAIE